MKKPVIFGSIGALAVIAALIVFRTRNDAADVAGQRYGTHPPHKREAAVAPPAPAIPRTPAEVDEAHRKYKEELRKRLEKDGLAANLKEASAKAMADYLRQDLFIQFITLSLEAEGLEKTVDQVLAGLEPGSQRDHCIMVAFANAKDDLAILQRKMLALASEEERKAAADGIESAIADRDIPLGELLALFPDPSMQAHVLTGAAQQAGSPFNPADRRKLIDRNVSDLVDLIRKDTIEKGAIGRFVRDAGSNAGGETPFHIWNSINNVERMDGLSIHPTTYKKLANSMLSSDPVRTFTSLAGSRIDLPPDVISGSAKSWLNQQNVQPVEWLETKGKDLSPAFRDAFVTGLVEYNLGKGGIDEGRRWAEQIQDPGIKQELQEKIDASRQK